MDVLLSGRGESMLYAMLASAALVASCSGPASQGTLHGTIERKLTDTAYRQFVLFVQPTQSSPSLGVRYDQQESVRLIVPHEVAGTYSKVISIFCGQLAYPYVMQTSDSIVKEKCILEADVVKQGSSYNAVGIRNLKMVPETEAISERADAAAQEAAQKRKKKRNSLRD